jgi:uncharacterized protein YdeI (YjbR/CyaY-like superfamily)
MPRDELPILEFADGTAWQSWLHERHASSPGAWLKIAKKDSGRTTVTYAEALEEALCYGWIDGQRAPHDESYFLQRFTPRRSRSKWSEINRNKAVTLIEQGRMTPAGIAQVEAARQDGRWEAAYGPQSTATVPEDFQRALDEDPAANDFFKTLRGVRRYAFLYRIMDAKRPETRARRIGEYVAMLAEGRTLR